MNVEIVVPVFNEQDNIVELYEQVRRVMEPIGLTWGLLYVDDGSRDETVARLEQLRARDPRVQFLSFTRNFGHQAALLAGLAAHAAIAQQAPAPRSAAEAASASKPSSPPTSTPSASPNTHRTMAGKSGLPCQSPPNMMRVGV